MQEISCIGRKCVSCRDQSIPLIGGAMLFKLRIAAAVFITALPVFAQGVPPRNAQVMRATLDNGMRVVIVRDPLAPVVTVEAKLSGRRQRNPAGFPGMAHAQEHMAFRGCSELTADQISAIFAQLGGVGNADTQQNITQYFRHRSRRRSGHRLARRRGLHARHSRFADRMGAGERRHRAGSGARPVQSDLQIHHAAE